MRVSTEAYEPVADAAPDASGLPLEQIGFITMAFLIPASFIRAFGGWLSDRLGARQVMYGVLAVSVACATLLALPLHPGVWSFTAVLFVLGVALVGAAMFLLPMLTFSRWAARRLGFDTEDEITAVMCGSKKSMASGVPMAKLLFGSHATLGLVVLPLLIYHQMQLFVCTWLARRYARRLPASS